MSEQIDWSKAPEGATHYSPEIPNLTCAAFWREKGGRLVEFWGVGGGTFNHRVNAEGYCKTPDECIARPATPSWSGEGLPPVGVVCELRCLPVGGWGKAEIKYMSETQCVWLWLREDGGYQVELAEVPDETRMAFRPIRTPEQIAADARRKAIDEMVKALGMDEPGTAEYIRCGLIYDAGFRKQ